MSEPVISACQLGKSYRLGATLAHNTLRDQIAAGLGRLFGASKQAEDDGETFWALRDVSFDVAAGEVVGIIGRNGAGKSTLLKILSQITEPTAGEVRVRGRLASLLEVGTGFHPELSGRENVFLNGAILGMTKAEIARKFDEIVSFAGVEKFLDTPVKRYSSGMYVRLAFAVAAHLEHEIMVVDEVLAVGDEQFQRRCLNKMHAVSTEGRAVIFVSHNMQALSALCQNGIVLDAGRIDYCGPIREAIASYTARVQTVREVTFPANSAQPSIVGIRIGEERLRAGDIVVEIEFCSPYPLDPPVGGIVLASSTGMPVYGTNFRMHPSEQGRKSLSRGVLRVEIASPPIHSGFYKISAWLGDWNVNYDQKLDALFVEFFSPRRVDHVPSLHSIGHLNYPASWTVAESGGTTRP